MGFVYDESAVKEIWEDLGVFLVFLDYDDHAVGVSEVSLEIGVLFVGLFHDFFATLEGVGLFEALFLFFCLHNTD